MARLLPTLIAIAACVILMAVPTPAAASGPDGLVPAAPAAPANENVVIAEQIGAQVPLDTVFRNEDDHPISLRDCTTGKPTILVPMYYRCPKLCNIVLENLIEALREIPNYSVGKEFNVVCVSFDPKEHADLAVEKRKNTLAAYGRPNAENSWRFLTGTKESIQTLTTAVGFRYEFDRTFKEYNHPSGLIILTPDGKDRAVLLRRRLQGHLLACRAGRGRLQNPRRHDHAAAIAGRSVRGENGIAQGSAAPDLLLVGPQHGLRLPDYAGGPDRRDTHPPGDGNLAGLDHST